MKLYEINEEINALINDETGEIMDIDKFNELQLKKEEKFENISLWIKNNDADSEALKNEAAALLERAKVIDNKNASIKQFLEKNMIENGITKIETSKVKLGFRKSTAVNVLDEEKFITYCQNTGHEELTKIKTTISLDKTAIKKWLQDNRSDFVSLEQRQNLQIK